MAETPVDLACLWKLTRTRAWGCSGGLLYHTHRNKRMEFPAHGQASDTRDPHPRALPSKDEQCPCHEINGTEALASQTDRRTNSRSLVLLSSVFAARRRGQSPVPCNITHRLRFCHAVCQGNSCMYIAVLLPPKFLCLHKKRVSGVRTRCL